MSQPAPATPVCYRHPSRETYVRCVRCDRSICPDCMREASVGFQCPQCVAEGQRSIRPARTAFGGTAAGRQGYVTISLITINVVMLVLAVVVAGARGLGGGGLGGLMSEATSLHLWGALIPAPTQYIDTNGDIVAVVDGVAGGEYYRLLSSMFLHYGVLHLFMNMWALWVLGRNLEYVLGPIRYLTLYLLSGLGGGVAVYWFSTPSTPTAGASGAIFGLFAAFFLVLRRLGRDTSFVVPVLVINLVFTFVVPSISIAGHLGGLVSGAIIGAGLAYAPQKNRTAIQAAVCVGFAVMLIALTLARTAVLTAIP